MVKFDIYKDICNGKTNEEIVKEFSNVLNETRAKVNKEREETIKRAEEQRKNEEELAQLRHEMVVAVVKYLNKVIPELGWNEEEIQTWMEEYEVHLRDNLEDMLLLLKAIL